MFQRLASLGRLLGAVAVSALTLLVVAEVIDRSLFGRSIEFMEELSGYLLVAITFLAAADSFASGSFMRVDILFVRLLPAARLRLDRVLATLAALLSLAITWFLGKLVWSSYHNGIISPGALAVPLWIPQFAMVVGMVLLAVACLRHALHPQADAPDAAPGDRLLD